jgi:quercetin dioxygenase-like cupin family protein
MLERSMTLSAPGSGVRIATVGDVYRLLLTGDDTEGRYALMEATVAPGSGPPLHVHSREEEGFHVLEGEITFYTERETIRATPGVAMNMPPGLKHRFRNESNQMARMLIVVAPSGLEKMFAEVGVVLSDSAMTAPPITPEEIERIVRIAPKYGIEIFPREH